MCNALLVAIQIDHIAYGTGKKISTDVEVRIEPDHGEEIEITLKSVNNGSRVISVLRDFIRAFEMAHHPTLNEWIFERPIKDEADWYKVRFDMGKMEKSGLTVPGFVKVIEGLAKL